MSIQSERHYKISNVKSGTVLDLSGTDGYSIIGWEWHGGDNQKWKLIQEGDGQWIFQNVGTGKFLGFQDPQGNFHDNIPVHAVDFPQVWNIFPDRNDRDVFRIYLPNASYPLNVDLTNYGSPENGTPVALWGENFDNWNQTWRFEAL